MEKNHYLVLGIASTASPREIKEAYRNLAKAFHPDHYGKNQAPFLEIQEAYSVLSDPVKRRRHDRAIQKKQELFSRGPSRSRPAVPVEPLIPGAPPSRGEALRGSYSGFRPSSGPEPLFSGRPAPGRDRRAPEPLRASPPWPEYPMEVLLTPEQAVQGGETRIFLPGHGAVRLSFAPGITDRERFRLGIDRFGRPRLVIAVTVRVLPD